MSDRGLTLLQLCERPPGSNARDDLWAALVSLYSAATLQRQLREYVRRAFVTTASYETAELTALGRERLREGLDLRASR